LKAHGLIACSKIDFESKLKWLGQHVEMASDDKLKYPSITHEMPADGRLN